MIIKLFEDIDENTIDTTWLYEIQKWKINDIN